MYALFIVLIALSLVSCAGERHKASERAAAPSSTQQRPIYIDVRTPSEYADGHVVGAINIPHGEMAERHTELAALRDSSLVVYCASGRRSALAIEVLKNNGFENVVNAGGLDDLRAQGVPVE